MDEAGLVRPPRIRTAQYADGESILELMRRNGLSAERSSADRWAALWRDNPAMPEGGPLPMGWVLEDSDAIVGYIGNIAMRYYHRGERLVAAAAHAFAVDADYRSHSLRLTAAFFLQPHVDLLLSATASAAAGAVYQLCKGSRIPQPDYDKALFQVIDEGGVARSILRRRGWRPRLAAIGGLALAPALRRANRPRRRHRPVPAARVDVSVLEPQNLNEAFDDFWQRTLADRPHTLLADRSRCVLRWHFGRRAAGVEPRFVCAWRSNQLVGYAVLTREDAGEIGLRRSRLADLMAEHDDPDVVDVLLHASFEQARANGSHMLELIGFPSRIRARFVDGGAYKRQLPAWPFWYKALSRRLAEALRDENVWYANPYDGDASLLNAAG